MNVKLKFLLSTVCRRVVAVEVLLQSFKLALESGVSPRADLELFWRREKSVVLSLLLMVEKMVHRAYNDHFETF